MGDPKEDKKKRSIFTGANTEMEEHGHEKRVSLSYVSSFTTRFPLDSVGTKKEKDRRAAEVRVLKGVVLMGEVVFAS